MTNTRVETFRRIVARHQYEEADGYLVDATTASLLVTVYDALKTDEARAKFETIGLARLVDFAWKQVA